MSKEQTLIIKSEDLQDPKKLAFVKAIVGSKYRGGDLVNYCDLTGLFIEWVDGLEFRGSPSLEIAISDIKLEPRLLIGEDVRCDTFVDGVGTIDWCKITPRNICMYSENATPNLQWLKENFEVTE